MTDEIINEVKQELQVRAVQNQSWKHVQCAISISSGAILGRYTITMVTMLCSFALQ